MLRLRVIMSVSVIGLHIRACNGFVCRHSLCRDPVHRLVRMRRRRR